MKPSKWGNGTWLLIFLVIFKFDDVETIKYLLYLICSSLPCDECINHIMSNMDKNNILDENDPVKILRFFITVRNMFQEKNKECIIDISKFYEKSITKEMKKIVLESFFYTVYPNDDKLHKIKTIING